MPTGELPEKADASIRGRRKDFAAESARARGVEATAITREQAVGRSSGWKREQLIGHGVADVIWEQPGVSIPRAWCILGTRQVFPIPSGGDFPRGSHARQKGGVMESWLMLGGG